MRRTLAPSSRGTVAVAVALAVVAAASRSSGPVPAVLVGWALLPADTFSDGPTSGQLARPNPYGTLRPPYPNRQPVQGFSAVLRGADDATFVVMTDNGFGARSDSADFLLRMYSVRPDFRTARGGTGTVSPGDYREGVSLHNYTAASRVALRDPDRRLGFPIQAQFEHQYDDPARPAVAPSIRKGRLLTGADLDVEAVRLDRDCHYWFGDEIGPYLVETDLSGAVLRAEIPIPGVFSPENDAVRAGAAVANLPRSGGIEGLAVNARGDRLYTLLEKAVAGDRGRLRRLQEFDVATASFTGATWFYPMERAGLSAAELTAVDDTHFLVIERNDDTGTEGRPFKRIFLASIDGVENGGRVVKTELVDLMKVADPDDLDGDGKATFSLPYATTEAVLVLDARTLLVVNDDNFPEGGGRAARADDTEFVKIRLDRRLPGFARRPAAARACFEAGR